MYCLVLGFARFLACYSAFANQIYTKIFASVQGCFYSTEHFDCCCYHIVYHRVYLNVSNDEVAFRYGQRDFTKHFAKKW
jgi:hypothetical protein